MIEDIELIGLTEKTIENLMEQLGYGAVLSMACNYKVVRANINLLKSFGIKDIDTLLLNRNHIFLHKTDELNQKFSNFNIPVLVELINEDYTVIDEVFG